MVLYLCVILISMALISTLNILLNLSALGVEWWQIILIVVLVTLSQFAIDGINAIIINRLPKNWFNAQKKVFDVSKKERFFYEKLKIRKWKDKVWELGALGGFRKNKIADPKNPEYIGRFIIEINKGVLVHLFSIFFGALAILIFPIKYALVICLPVILINAVLNVLPIMVLRYNFPKLKAVYNKLIRQNEIENLVKK